MIIEKLVIRNFHRIRALEIAFEPSVIVLPRDQAKTTLKAIGILTKNETFAGPERNWKFRKNTFLQAEIRLAVGLWKISCRQDPETLAPFWKVAGPEGNAIDPQRFFHRIHQCPAEAEIRCYNARTNYEELLRAYEDPDRYFPPGAFFRQTEGIGTTRLFRKKLKELREQGALYAEGEPENYQIFLEINALWDEIEEIRDLHHERWPVFIIGPISMEKVYRIQYYVEDDD